MPSNSSQVEAQPTASFKRKGVTFAPTCQVRPTITRSSMTKQEKGSAWYSAQESERIRAKNARLVEVLENGKGYHGNKKYCTRGLEGYTSSGSREKMVCRTTAWMVVLDEQDRQMEKHDVVNYENIASTYHQVVSSCQLWASILGQRDWKAALAIYSDEDLQWLENQRDLKVEDVDVDQGTKAQACNTLSPVQSSSMTSKLNKDYTLKNSGSCEESEQRSNAAMAA